MAAITWLRLADDRLIRADQIVEVDLWGPPPAHDARQPTVPIMGKPARIMALRDGAEPAWLHVATCAAVRGGELIMNLLGTLTAAASRQSGVAFVYGLRHAGELSRWSHGSTIPFSDPRVPVFHEVEDPSPGRWFAVGARQEASRASGTGGVGA